MESSSITGGWKTHFMSYIYLIASVIQTNTYDDVSVGAVHVEEH